MTFSANTYVGEIWEITTFDGLVYQSSDYYSRAVLTTPGDLGLPPIDFITRKPYKQPGEVELTYRLNPRDFSISLATRGCSRAAYWQARQDLLQVCRPNRGGVVTVTLTQEDGTKRSILARCLSPVFPEQSVDVWNEWGFTEQVILKALDPIWFNPSVNSSAVASAAFTELAFPITFDADNIWFGNAGFFGSRTFAYTGTWYSRPKITITGPFTTAYVYHQQLGNFIEFLQAISAGSTLVIDLQPDVPSVTINGVDYFGFLAPQSDISQFRIEVDPLVSGGNNTLGFNLPGYTGATTVNVEYKTRYIGI